MLSCLNREFGRDNLQKSLSISTIPWFCELQHLVLHLSWAAAVHSLKAENFTNTSEGTRWCFSKQKQLMQKKVTCLLGNVALKVSVTLPADKLQEQDFIVSETWGWQGRAISYSCCQHIHFHTLHIARGRWNLHAAAGWLFPMESHVMSLVLLLQNSLTINKDRGTEKNTYFFHHRQVTVLVVLIYMLGFIWLSLSLAWVRSD